MTRYEIADKLGLRIKYDYMFVYDIQKLVREAVATEREACAKVCNELRHPNYSAETAEWIAGTTACAEAIRARGEVKS